VGLFRATAHYNLTGRRRRVGLHRCLTCKREWCYTTVPDGLFKLILATLHVWWRHEDTDVSPTKEQA
jgi:hypothetical protein